MSQAIHATAYPQGPRLECLLRPRSIAIVGASEKPGSLGDGVLRNLEDVGYPGPLFLINPRRDEIRGRACLGTIDDLPNGVDCAVLAIPGRAVLGAASECARRGVRSLIVFSSGFAESGPEGLALQNQLADLARSQNMIIQGPNCLGLVNHVDRVPLTFVRTEVDPPAAAGGVAIVSQSGALAAVFGVSLRHHGLRLSYSVSTGNEVSLHLEEVVEHLLPGDHTQVFALIVEQFRQPRRFLVLADRARAMGKFLVLLHPGKSIAGRDSAATHTGAMAGDYDVMRTILTGRGVQVVDTMEELSDVCQLLIHRPSLPRRGPAIVAESGAFRSLALDLCESLDLDLPSFSQSTCAALRNALPSFIPESNPLDLTAHALVDSSLYTRTLKIILADEEIGSIVLAIILTDKSTCDLKLPSILAALQAMGTSKPILFAAMDEGAPVQAAYIARLRELHVPFYPSPERALRALACVTRIPAAVPRFDAGPLAAKAEKSALIDGVNPEHRTKRLLAQYGIPVPTGSLAHSRSEALHVAGQIGFPVALKAQSSGLSHKSDAGGVFLNLVNEDELESAWQRLEDNLARTAPGLKLDGVLVERMAQSGVELILGAKNDSQWGPIVLAGSGGILAEAMQDRLLIDPDTPPAGIVAEFQKLRCAPLLRGFRGSAPRDLPAAAHIASNLVQILRDFPEIEEIEINPVVLYAEGDGAIALDGLTVVVRSS